MDTREVCRLCGSTNTSSCFGFDGHHIVHHLRESLDQAPGYAGRFDLRCCMSCGFLFSPGYFAPKELIYKDYITLSGQKEQPHAKRLIDNLKGFGVSHDSSIFEIGCNDGSFLDELKADGFGDVWAVEPARDAYKRASERHSKISNVYFTRAFAEESIGSERFDVVVTRQVLEHIEDLDDFLQGISCVLHSEGILAIEVPDHTMSYTFFGLFILGGAPALFQVLSERGFFPRELLRDFGKPGSVFHEHPPKPGYIAGIEAATGSLGHGLPMSLGMALAARIQKQNYRCYALLSDGECNEGTIWEAAMLAAGQSVDNLTVIIDYNKWQATGRSQEIMALEPLAEKWKAFGWHAQEVDGHSFNEIGRALDIARDTANRPSAIIAHTVKGKGVSFMEDNNNWHYRTPNAEETLAALGELGGTST